MAFCDALNKRTEYPKVGWYRITLAWPIHPTLPPAVKAYQMRQVPLVRHPSVLYLLSCSCRELRAWRPCRSALRAYLERYVEVIALENVAEQFAIMPVLNVQEQCSSTSMFRLPRVNTVPPTCIRPPNQVHSSVLTLLRGQFAVPGAAESPLALRLAALPESLELCRTTSPLFTATLADTMLALRLFSFS